MQADKPKKFQRLSLNDLKFPLKKNRLWVTVRDVSDSAFNGCEGDYCREDERELWPMGLNGEDIKAVYMHKNRSSNKSTSIMFRDKDGWALGILEDTSNQAKLKDVGYRHDSQDEKPPVEYWQAVHGNGACRVQGVEYKEGSFEGSLWQHMYDHASSASLNNWNKLQNCMFSVCEYYYRQCPAALALGADIQKQSEDHAEMFVVQIFEHLKDDYETRISQGKPIHQKRLPKNLQVRVHGHLVELVRMWTLQSRDNQFQKEWCAMLQFATRCDDPVAVYAAAQVWRGMNMMLVTNRNAGAADELVSEIPKDRDLIRDVPGEKRRGNRTLKRKDAIKRGIRLEHGVLYRGLQMPPTHLEWYRKNRGKTIRNKQATATSPDKSTAFPFMLDYGYADGQDELNLEFIMFKFKFDKDLKCDHVSALDFLSFMECETEYLFCPYSAFRVGNVLKHDAFDENEKEWMEQEELEVCCKHKKKDFYWEIEMIIEPDNRNKDAGGLLGEDVPVAPWM